MIQKPARLLFADDHLLVAETCAKMLESQFEIAGIVTDGRALVQAALQLKPDVAIIEMSLSQLNGLAAAEQIKQKLPTVKIVFLTMDSNPQIAVEAFRRGASAYVLKHSGAEELVTAIRYALRGQSFLSSLIARETMAHLLEQREHHRKTEGITWRQSEILRLLSEGLTMKEIANVLEIKPGTVAFHKYRMMAALGVTTNAGLLAYAMKNDVAPA